MGKKIAEGTIKKKIEKIKNANVEVKIINNKFKNDSDVIIVIIEIDQLIEPSMRPRVGHYKNIYDPLEKYKKILREKIIEKIEKLNKDIPIGENYCIKSSMELYKEPPSTFTLKEMAFALFDHSVQWNKKPDCDNYQKTMFDTVEKIIFFNDGQIFDESTKKYYGMKEKTIAKFIITEQPSLKGRLTKDELSSLPEDIVNYIKNKKESKKT